MSSAWQRAADRLGFGFDSDRVVLYGSLRGVDVSIGVASRSLAMDDFARGPIRQGEVTVARARLTPPLDADLELEHRVLTWTRIFPPHSSRAVSVVEPAIEPLLALGKMRFDGWIDDNRLRLEVEGMASDEDWLVEAAHATSVAGQALHAARMRLPVREDLEAHVPCFDAVASELGLTRCPSALGVFGTVDQVGAMAHAHTRRRGIEPWGLTLRTAGPSEPPFPVQVVKHHPSFFERHHLSLGSGPKTGDAELDANAHVVGDAERFRERLGPARDDLLALLQLDQLSITGSVVSAESPRFEDAALLARATRVSAALSGILATDTSPYR